MKRVFCTRPILLALWLLVAMVALPGVLRAQPQDPTPPASCCYTNTAYAGVCKVTPEVDETCDTILAYLNTQGTVGKNYCSGTKVRGGWKQVDCPAANNGVKSSSTSNSSKEKQTTRVCVFKKGS